MSQIHDKLFQERRLILIEAVNGPRNDLPDYKHVSLSRINTTSTLGNSKVGTGINDQLPPLPPRSQSSSRHGSSNLLGPKVQNPAKSPSNTVPLDLEGFSFPSSSEPQTSIQNDDLNAKNVESRLPIESSCSLNDFEPLYSINDATLNSQLSIRQPLMKEEYVENTWQSQITVDHADVSLNDSWSNDKHHLDEPQIVFNASIGGDSSITERMAEMYSKQTTEIDNTQLPKLPNQSEMPGFDENPWN